MKANTITIKDRIIGDGYPAYIIAEMSANHAGSIQRAIEIIHAAKECGADCIKIQTYTPDTLTIDCNNKYFNIVDGTWEGENLYSLYGKAYTPWDWQARLKAEADAIGIDFFSTPFDKTSVDFLEDMGMEFYKIASFEMVDLPLISYIARRGKPIIMSTGMGSLEEIQEAVDAVFTSGNKELALLKCSSAYPAISEDMNLQTIRDMKQRFSIPIGLSDHSMGSLGASTAVALGANIIEKHFCMSREIDNPDASFSMTPDEFQQMVMDIRSTEKAMGKVAYGVAPQEESSVVFRRSVFIVEDIKKGDTFTEVNTRIIRPGYGMKPKYMSELLGLQANMDINRGTPATFELVKKKCILFLTNNENTKDVYSFLVEKQEDVCKFSNKLNLEIVKQFQPEFIVSYNYKYIIPKDVVEYMGDNIINLHISYLPFNRGSSPNFFSFYDNTLKGVTIHKMAAGLDTGDILCQKATVFVEKEETFASAYEKLSLEMAQLFRESWDQIKNGKLSSYPQEGNGTYHTMKELEGIREKYPFSWSDNIAQWKEKYSL